MNTKLLATIGMASALWAASANANSIQIGLQEAGFNGGAICNAAACAGVTSFGAGTTAEIAGGAFGTFSVTLNTGTTSAPGDPLLSSNTNDTSNGTAGTLTIYVTVQDLTAPTGTFAFLSSFQSLSLPTGWALTEETVLSTSNALWGSGGATLDSATQPALFSGGPAVSQTMLAATGAGPYSLTEIYTITSTTGSTDNTNDSQTLSAPGPTAGAGLPGLILAGVFLFASRRSRLARIRVAAAARRDVRQQTEP